MSYFDPIVENFTKSHDSPEQQKRLPKLQVQNEKGSMISEQIYLRVSVNNSDRDRLLNPDAKQENFSVKTTESESLES